MSNQLRDIITNCEKGIHGGPHRHFTVFVQTNLSDRTLTTLAMSSDTPDQIGREIVEKLGVSNERRYTMMFGGVVLSFDQTLEHYGIVGGSTLQLNVREK